MSVADTSFATRSLRVRWPLRVALASLAFGLFGCVSERVSEGSSVRPLPPEPRAAPVTPSTARVNRMALMIIGPKPIDTDGNGRPDTIPIEVFLFAEPHPTPVFEDGAFVFDLYAIGEAGDKSVPPITSWRFEGEMLAGHQGRGMIGPMYRFALSLLDQGGDDLGLPAVDLVASFHPADGRRPIRSSGVRTLQMMTSSGK